MEWPIQDIARMTGVTSRTLRHYDDIGLLTPDRIGANGYRYYSSTSLLRLQRILLLRDLGLGLQDIRHVLDRQIDTVSALRKHLDWLHRERDRLADQIASLESTLQTLDTTGKEDLMPENMFRGFDHTQYKEEVIERWGRDAWESGDRWWRSLTADQQQAFQQQQLDIATDFGRAMLAGKNPASDEAQAIVQRQFEWLSITTTPTKDYFIGLGEMYVNDPRFTAHYDQHGTGTAIFVRDAMKIYAERKW